MKITLEKTSSIKPYGKNAKKHPVDQIKKIAASIQRFGFQQPLVVDKDKNLIVGHGRLLAALELKMDEVPCLTVENLSQDEIKAYRLADNKLNESAWDMDLALPELGELTNDLQVLTGFDLENFDFKPIDVIDRLDQKQKIVCPNCQHEFEA